MKRPLISLTIVACFVSAGAARGQANLAKAMKSFLSENLPGQGFLPTPYGADSRFAPKSVWVFAKDLSTKTGGTGQSNGWVRFSSGEVLFPLATVPIYCESVNLSIKDDDVVSQLGLIAAAKGLVSESLTVDAALEAKLKNSSKVTVKLEGTEVCWIDDGDYLMSKKKRNAEFADFDGLIADRKVTRVRIVVAALRVRKADIRLAVQAEAGGKIDADISAFLTKVGVSASRETGGEILLGWDVPRYLGFVAREANSFKEIGTNAELPPDDHESLRELDNRTYRLVPPKAN